MAPRDRSLPDEIGRYRVIRLHGQGAMGRVFLAHDSVLDRDVAVKLLRDDLGVPDDQRNALLDRMRQEARAAARVSHPNIVGLHDMGEDPELGLYLVFEYLEGATLKERLERGALGAIAAARLAVELGSALTTAHEAGVLHRDVKPENIILTATGGKIADFGIARLPDSTLTMGGTLLGTPAYSAPEAVSGGRFSPKSDQFSMAATLYEAISGKRAFPGDDAIAVARKIEKDEVPPVASAAGVDLHVDTVLLRALSKDPRERFDTCEEFGNALSEALRMAPRSTMQTLPDQAHREAQEAAGVRVARAATGGIAIGAMLAIVGFQLTAHLRQRDPDERREPPAQANPQGATGLEAAPVAWLEELPKSAKASSPKSPPKPPDRPKRNEASADGLRRGDGGASPAADAGKSR
ncbi:MAG TPA: serine/threonine-protein kinase [Polyangiaceae bacterium]|nr:serine/threonine-protein kinase [Polyangiaceae bacterium]